MKKIAVFVSGSGSDLQSIIDAIESGYISNVSIATVIASKDGIYAIERCKKHNIDCKVFKKNDYANNAQKDMHIREYLRAKGVEFIVLAGYLSILTNELVDYYERRIINIHPSLIPSHCGPQMYGLKVHESVINSKDKITGVTIHYVDLGTDTGEIIEQEKVEVLENDTPETLQLRVLEVEHKMLPRVIKKLLEGVN